MNMNIVIETDEQAKDVLNQVFSSDNEIQMTAIMGIYDCHRAYGETPWESVQAAFNAYTKAITHVE